MASSPLTLAGPLPHRHWLLHLLLTQGPGEALRWALRLAGTDFSLAELEATYESIVIRSARAHMDACREAFRFLYEVDHKAPAKFARYEYWLRLNIMRCIQLGLHSSPALRILDLGAGAGYFVAAARQLGHCAIGLDRLPQDMTLVESIIYAEIPTALGVRVLPRTIQPFRPLVIDGSFDLITGFMVCFNDHMGSHEWSAREWRYFVEDCRSHLTRHGRLVLDLNPNRERYGHLTWYDRETRDYFQTAGRVRRGRVELTARRGEVVAAQVRRTVVGGQG